METTFWCDRHKESIPNLWVAIARLARSTVYLWSLDSATTTPCGLDMELTTWPLAAGASTLMRIMALV